MKPPLFVRPLSAEEQQALVAGLRSPVAFTLRRCQILLASARGRRPRQIADQLGCDPQTVRTALHAFAARGLAALPPGSSVPHTIGRAFDVAATEQLQALVHRSPREFGKPTSLWTLALLADVCAAEGITPGRVSAETVRVTLLRQGLAWRRAKHWLTSSDGRYDRKKAGVRG